MAPTGNSEAMAYTPEQVHDLTSRANSLLDELREILGEMTERLQGIASTEETGEERDRATE